MNIKKIAASLLACAVIGGVLPYSSGVTENPAITVSAAEEYTGGTYESLTYLKYSDHVEISGCDISVTEVIIPSEIEGVPVTSIGNAAFRDCSGLTSITISDGVTSIGDVAFEGCSGLTSITIPNSVTSIGDCAFRCCSSLTSITIPDSVTSIGGLAFDDTPWLDSQRKISPLVIVNNILIDGQTCEGDIVIPDDVTSIGNSAFYRCSGLTSITIPDSITIIGDGAFEDCSSLTSITIPNSVTSIGCITFYRCFGLTSITIPDSVTSIGDGAFWGCSGLTSVEIPDGVTSIGDSAFNICSSLTSITIPDSVTSIGEWAFSSCSSLTSITIPNSVASIGYFAFGWCDKLTSITINNPECEIYDDGSTFTNDFDSTLTATIYGYKNSTAQAYAEKYGRNFKILSEAPTTTTPETTLSGDADLDGKVGISDVVKVMMYVANKEANPLSEQGLINADVYSSGDGVFISDALSIQKKVAQIIDTLPES